MDTDQPLLRIFICGSHSVGKTTLVKLLARQTQIHDEAEVARRVIHNLGLHRDDFDPEKNPKRFLKLQEEIIREQSRTEQRNSECCRSYIADRGIDPVVYAAEYLGEKEADYLLSLAETQESIARYQTSLVFVIKPFPECFMEDNVRLSPRIDEAVAFTAAMEALLHRLQITYTLIDVLDVQERVNIVKEKIAEWRGS
ncbi:uncharacterized protein LOC5515746 [Nematostella vectensis]|uniref:uncharacterized protein LOC5515746 n=1 Tax=Nematostella vectensis TaxID=45351 RepID=UPI0020773C7B|nr:uncharacterized protein LOC5515746 [Nematostella vectensis]